LSKLMVGISPDRSGDFPHRDRRAPPTFYEQSRRAIPH
jgi:hypothetical protein